MKRAICVAVAALGLVGWVDPKTAAPTVSQDALKAEEKRQLAFVISSRWKESERVKAVAFRLALANQDLCADRKRRTGMDVFVLTDFPQRYREAAAEVLKVGPELTITEVVPASPAAKAGLRRGDALVSLNGAPVPTGAKAREGFIKQLASALEKPGPVTLAVRREGAVQELTVEPVSVCAYDAVVEDSDVINAFADGQRIHITRGILRFAADEEELALIVAHEMAHNGQHHMQAQARNSIMVGLGGLLLDGVAAAYGVNTQGVFAKTGARIGAEHASPEFEAEADYVGMYYLARAGYPTEGVENLWRRMAVETPGAVFIKTDHPVTPERFLAIAATAREIEAKRVKGEPLVPNMAADSKAH